MTIVTIDNFYKSNNTISKKKNVQNTFKLNPPAISHDQYTDSRAINIDVIVYYSEYDINAVGFETFNRHMRIIKPELIDYWMLPSTCTVLRMLADHKIRKTHSTMAERSLNSVDMVLRQFMLFGNPIMFKP